MVPCDFCLFPDEGRECPLHGPAALAEMETAILAELEATLLEWRAWYFGPHSDGPFTHSFGPSP